MQKLFVVSLMVLGSLPLMGQQPSASAREKEKPKTVAPAHAATSAAKPAAAASSEGSAQTVPPDAPSREDVLKLFDLLQLNKTVEQAMRIASQQGKNVAEQLLNENMPDATTEQRASFNKFMEGVMDDVFGSISIQQMLEDAIPVYQRHLTRSDLKAMMDFYSSPVGQKLLKEQPQMMQESMQAMQGRQQQMMRAMMAKIDERVKEMAKSVSEKGDKKQ